MSILLHLSAVVKQRLIDFFVFRQGWRFLRSKNKCVFEKSENKTQKQDKSALTKAKKYATMRIKKGDAA
jgi:hypothetical protein